MELRTPHTLSQFSNTAIVDKLAPYFMLLLCILLCMTAVGAFENIEPYNQVVVRITNKFEAFSVSYIIDRRA